MANTEKINRLVKVQDYIKGLGNMGRLEPERQEVLSEVGILLALEKSN